MDERVVYHVQPVATGGWRVEREQASRASSTHPTKAAAVERAKELAKSHPLGQVIIHRQDGTLQTEHTYGADPRTREG
jgi:hypothetical protein